MRLAGEEIAGLPEVIEQIERKHRENERMMREQEFNSPAPDPYHPELNPDPTGVPGNHGTNDWAGVGGEYPADEMAAAYNRREPFPVRNDINVPIENIPAHPLMGPDGQDKFPGFEIRNVMPKV